MTDKYPSISAYAYAFNNPLRYIDPTGMEGEDVTVPTPAEIEKMSEENAVWADRINNSSTSGLPTTTKVNNEISGADARGGEEPPGDTDNWWSNLGTGIGLLGDWLFYGDQDRTFNNDKVARSLMNSRISGEARDYWYSKVNAGEKSITDPLTNFAGESRVGGGNFGITGYFMAGVDPIEQYIGSTHYYSITSDGANLTHTITNITHFRSLMYGLTPEWLN